MRNPITTRSWFAAAWFLSFALLAEDAATAHEYWVSTTGNDADAGTQDEPFATLERARDAVREARKAGPPAACVTVWLRGGVYRMDKTFELGARFRHSGRAGGVPLRTWRGGAADGWSADTRDRLPAGHGC